jgi:uncharacterized protein (DUF2235 family)
MTKRLVVCLDGTWNSPDQGKNPTNVVKIMEAVRPTDGAGTRQITFYDAGIGADAGRIDRITDGFTGRGLEQNVRDGYRFLAHNWEPGDEIYLFGFSRGAFTARSLCGFLSACGLLERHAMRRLLEAWELYRLPEEQRPPDRLAALRAVSRCDVKVECIGVWDTVGALGVPGELLQAFNRDHRFHDTELCDMVDCAFHAVAIDEKRGPFGPTLWQKPKGERLRQRVVEQVWFPGVHSNVGGSCADAGLSDLALHWMIRRVQAHTALAFDERYITAHVKPDPMAEIYESRSALYTDSKIYPYQRLIGQNAVKGSVFRRLVARTNQPGEGCEFVNEMIHWSAIERFGKVARENGRNRLYEPENLASAISKLPVADELLQEQPARAA